MPTCVCCILLLAAVSHYDLLRKSTKSIVDFLLNHQLGNFRYSPQGGAPLDCCRGDPPSRALLGGLKAKLTRPLGVAARNHCSTGRKESRLPPPPPSGQCRPDRSGRRPPFTNQPKLVASGASPLPPMRRLITASPACLRGVPPGWPAVARAQQEAPPSPIHEDKRIPIRRGTRARRTLPKQQSGRRNQQRSANPQYCLLVRDRIKKDREKQRRRPTRKQCPCGRAQRQ